MNPLSNDIYEQLRQQSRNLANRNRTGTGVRNIITGQDSQTHHMDQLERFQKDFSAYDRERRQYQKIKRQNQLQKRRIQNLQRQNKRWTVVQENQNFMKERMRRNWQQIQQGRRRTANSNGLPYNPINLTYDNNQQGQRLKLNDQDHKIRGYIRAQNMDRHGNSAYNPLNGQARRGIDHVIPQQLNSRYVQRLHDFQQSRRLRVPQSSNQSRNFRYY